MRYSEQVLNCDAEEMFFNSVMSGSVAISKSPNPAGHSIYTSHGKRKRVSSFLKMQKTPIDLNYVFECRAVHHKTPQKVQIYLLSVDLS